MHDDSRSPGDDENGLTTSPGAALDQPPDELSLAPWTGLERFSASQHLELALSAGRMGTWEWEIVSNLVQWSTALERIHGLEPGTFAGRLEDFERDIHPEDRSRVRTAIEAALEGDESYSVTYRIVRPDGEVRWLEATGQVVRDDDDLPVRMLGVCSDVTDRKQLEDELRMQKSLLEAQSDASTEAILVAEADGRILFANRRFCDLWRITGDPVGWSVKADLLDRLGDLVLQPGDVDFLLRNPQPETSMELALEDGRILEGYGRHLDAGGEPVRGWFFRDITDHRRRADAKAFLAEAGKILASSLGYRATLERVTHLAVPQLADWCSIEMLENGVPVQLAVSHRDPTKVRLVEELRERYPPTDERESPLLRVLQTGKPEFMPSISPELLEQVAVDDRHLRDLTSLGFTSAIIAPLNAHGTTIGALVLAMAESDHRLTEQDLEVAEDLAALAALSVENARLYAERSAIAQHLQRALLPPSVPAIPGLDIAARYFPASERMEVGGDFYDAFQTSKQAWAVVIGNVCGKGPEAAALTGLARHTLRGAAQRERRPEKILHVLNRAILEQADPNTFCTVAYSRIMVSDLQVRMTFASGGHPAPLQVSADGRVEEVPLVGSLLGVFSKVEIGTHQLELQPGQTIVFYTDGLIEGPPDRFRSGTHRLVRTLEAVAGLDADSIADRVEQSLVPEAGEIRSDDIALLVVRRPPD